MFIIMVVQGQISETLNLINSWEETFEGRIKLSFMKVRRIAVELREAVKNVLADFFR